MIISIANQKGGVGKSTLAQNINAGLQLEGYNTLIIDLDPQGNLTYSMNGESDKGDTVDLINGNTSDIITRTEQGDMIQYNADLTLIELNNAYHLLNALKGIKGAYDIVLIDTAPTLSLLTTNALTASDSVIIPVEASIYSVQGLGQLSDTINLVKEHSNPSLNILGLVLTRFSDRMLLNQYLKEVLDDSAKKLDTSLFNTTIREAVAIREAQAYQEDIFNYDAKSKVAKDFKDLTNEIIQRLEGGNYD